MSLERDWLDEMEGQLCRSNACRQQIVEMLMEVVIDVMQVFDFGAQKHPDSGDTPNFLTPEGNKCSLHVRGSSVLRHAARTFMRPDLKDDESKVNELLHLISSAAILYIRQKRNIVHPEDQPKEIEYQCSTFDSSILNPEEDHINAV